MFKQPEQYRVKNHHVTAMNSNNGDPYGSFIVKLSTNVDACVICSNGEGWEHVSVHIEDRLRGERTPTWAEMCKIKDLFWDPEDCVVQYHPPKSEYVNNHKHTLHLWRPLEQGLPVPPSILVGLKNLNLEDDDQL